MKQSSQRKQKFYRLLSVLLCFALAAGCFLGGGTEVQGAVKRPELFSRAAYLWDITDDEVLYEKEAGTHYANASTTKMMTAILAIERLKPDQVITFSAEAASRIPTKLWAGAGESFYMKDLLYSLLVPSHNDTAVALAEAVAGSEAAFAGEMNRKAKAIGCTNTDFVTANGLDTEGRDHGSSARDLALIMRYGLRYPAFEEAIRTNSRMIYSLNWGRAFALETTSAEFQQMSGAIGGKTGYTRKAGYCFAGYFERSGHKFIGVTLGAPGNAARWSDWGALMHYAEQYRTENPTESVTITWKPVKEAQGYTVWYSQDGGPNQRLGVTEETTFTKTGIPPGTDYRFTVRPWVKESGKVVFGAPCNRSEGTIRPQQALISKVVVTDAGEVKVALKREALGANRYAMCYAKTKDFTNKNNYTIGIRTSFPVRTMARDLEPGTYYARVRAYKETPGKPRVYSLWSPAVKFVVP